ncbi:MAG: AraC family transcriptional regulator [Chitinophagaceae bacterium]
MKIIETNITTLYHNHFFIIERNDFYFNAPFHFHSEFELVYIIESFGKRIIGDTIENFKEGDLVFLGSNLPHVWLCDELYHEKKPDKKARSIVIYFDRNIFSEIFYELKETQKINKLFEAASRGIKITGNKQIEIAAKMHELMHKKNFERIICFLEILHSISIAEEVEYINNKVYPDNKKRSYSDRLAEVCKYINTNFKNKIMLKDVAAIAHLTPPSFCRLFKNRLNKNFVEYLNEVRISQACKYLIDTDWDVSQIAYACGFKTVSNFNKLFKLNTKFAPGEYRLKIFSH